MAAALLAAAAAGAPAAAALRCAAGSLRGLLAELPGGWLAAGSELRPLVRYYRQQSFVERVMA